MIPMIPGLGYRQFHSRLPFYSHASYFNLGLILVDACTLKWIIVVVLLSTPGREGLDGFSHYHQVIQFIDACVGEAEADDAIRVEYHPVTTCVNNRG